MAIKNKAKVQHLEVRAVFKPETYNESDRTVDVVFATNTPVRRYDWANDRSYDEVLSFEKGHMRTERLDAGAPLLDNHYAWTGVRSTLGVVESYALGKDQATATLRFSNREDVKPVLQDVKDGILRNISCGYRVHEYKMEGTEDDNKVAVYRAIDWEPFEISLVNMPADPKSGVRSAESEAFTEVKLSGEIKTRNTNNKVIMKRDQIIALLKKRGITVDDNITDEALNEQLERALNVETPPPAPPATPEVTPAADVQRAATEAVAAERQRATDINLATRSAGLPAEFGEKLIADGKTIDEARAEIITEFAKGDPNKGRSGNWSVGKDLSEEMRRDASQAALIMRSNPELLRDTKTPLFSAEVIKEAQRYRNMTLLDFAREACVRGGVNVEGLDRMEIVGRAFTMSTSDFPVLLEGTNRRTLLAAYQIIADTWRQFCSVGSVSDFREYSRLRMGTIGDLDAVQENGEFKNKNFSDADFEKISVDTRGNLISVTRKMIINDDLGGITRIAAMIGRAAARTIENAVYRELGLNAGLGPVMQDGLTLFHATHGNIATAGAPTVAVLEAMRVQMGTQKDKDGNDFLDIFPDLALAPMGLGATLRVLNESQFNPDVTNKFQIPNITRGLFSKVIDTPRLTGSAFYMFANPDQEPVMEVSFLNGQQEPVMESRQGWSVDGVEWKVRQDFGVGAVGYRGALRNAGA